MEKDFLKDWAKLSSKLKSVDGDVKNLISGVGEEISSNREEAKDNYIASKINSEEQISQEEKRYIKKNTKEVFQKYLKGLFNS